MVCVTHRTFLDVNDLLNWNYRTWIHSFLIRVIMILWYKICELQAPIIDSSSHYSLLWLWDENFVKQRTLIKQTFLTLYLKTDIFILFWTQILGTDKNYDTGLKTWSSVSRKVLSSISSSGTSFRNEDFAQKVIFWWPLSSL